HRQGNRGLSGEEAHNISALAMLQKTGGRRPQAVGNEKIWDEKNAICLRPTVSSLRPFVAQIRLESGDCRL
ncbi:MAG: hypothetical protein PHR77_15955, partial [Kiritimatiellae bacterium]|nr:hypothetical protein [Kiritimatiellia bacterium]